MSMKTNNTVINSIMKKYICAVAMLLGMSVSAWGAIPSGYELVDALSDLSTGDYVVLYNATSGYGVSGIGNCVDGEYVSGYEATVSTTEGMWIQYYVTKGASDFTLKDKDANKFVVRSSNSFTYGNSGTAFTVSSSGGLVENTKSLIATTVFSGKSCERASARWGTPGTLYAVYKVGSTKIKEDNDYYTVSPTSSISITIDGEDGYFSDYSDDWLANVTAKVAFGGAIWAEFTGFPSSVSDYLYTVNQSSTATGFILNKTANAAQVTDKIGLNYYGYSYISNGTYSGYLHVYPANPGSNTDIEYYIPLTITVENSVDCTAHDITLTDGGSKTHGSFSTSPADEQCEGESVTISASPDTGYEPDDWTVLDGSANEVSLSGSGNTRTFTMPTSDVEVEVTFKAASYTITLDRNGGTTGAESITTTYNSSTITGWSAPTKTGYTFNGYYDGETSDNGSGNLVISTSGVLQAGVTGYTGALGIWTKTSKPTTLYAKWTVNSHKVSVASSIANVTVTATPSGGSAIAEGSYNAAVNYGTSVALSASAITTGYAFNSWVVTKDADESDVTASVVDGNTLTMPDYDVTVSATLYAKGKLQTRCLAEPEFTVTGSVYLTSYANVEVFTTANPDNRITITCSDFESADRLYITYLNGSGETVAKVSSLFRLCNTDYTYADASNDYIDISAVDWSSGEKFCIAYKPGASEYDQTDTWTIRLTAKKGTSTDLGHQDLTVRGRALPEEFVVAAKYNGQWYALPADMSTSSGTVPTPYLIGVNDRTTPTAATYAPSAALFTCAGRYAPTSNRGGLRLKSTTTQIDSKDAYVTAPNSASETYLYLATGATDFQDWYLTSTDFSSYTVQINPSVTNGRALRMNGGNIGYYTTGTTTMYLLPVTNEMTVLDATVTEWGQHSVILAVNAASASGAKIRVENGSPTAKQTITPINAVASSAKNFKVPVGAIDLADLSTNEGKILYVDWLDGSDDVYATSYVTIPRIIASSRDMYKTGETTKGPWNTEVHVLPDATLTANTASYSPSGATIKELHIYPGATLNVSTGTLTATTLRLRNGWTRAGSTQYNTARVYIADDAALTKTTASMDYDIYNSAEGRHYYPLAVPFQTAVSTIDYADTYLAGFSNYGASGQYVIKEYDGARRAENGPDQANNWSVVSSSGNLTPGKGYIMTAVPVKGEAIIRIPLVYNDAWTSDGEKGTANYDDADHTKNVVAVTAHTGTAAAAHDRHKGWNMLGVPFMSCYGNVDDIYSGGGAAALINGELVVNTEVDENMEYGGEEIPYVSVPSHDFAEYIQTDITEAELLPGWSFLVQVKTSGNLTFAVANQQDNDAGQIYAPKRTTEDDVVVKTGIILSGADASDKTTILISNQYSGTEYEIGADLEKMFGTGYTLALYSLSGETRLAYNAMSPAEAQGVIPLGFRAPEDGTYTFSLNPKFANAPLERVDLIDYQANTLTNLKNSSYTFTTVRTQNDERFALNIVPSQQTPTDIDNAQGDNAQGTKAYKVIIDQKMYIILGGKMYDATGKRVKEINK